MIANLFPKQDDAKISCSIPMRHEMAHIDKRKRNADTEHVNPKLFWLQLLARIQKLPQRRRHFAPFLVPASHRDNPVANPACKYSNQDLILGLPNGAICIPNLGRHQYPLMLSMRSPPQEWHFPRHLVSRPVYMCVRTQGFPPLSCDNNA
jgi:hypothetical protein